jgi:SEC-C motif
VTGTVVTCPRCRAQVQIGGTFSNVTMSGSLGANILVTCPACRNPFDAAPSATPGGTVRVDTVGGRLQVTQLIRELRAAPAAQVEALLAELRNAPPGKTLAEIADQAAPEVATALRRFGVGLARDLLIALIVTFVMARVGPEPVTQGEIDKFMQAQRTQSQQIERELRTVDRGVREIREYREPRNAPCRCGSGHKHKHCCGAPPGASRRAKADN